MNSSNSQPLLARYNLHDLSLKNRVIMAPMTRNRTGENNVPQEMNITYYRQRCNAGLIITEATPVNPLGHGYPMIPGIYTEDQVKGWRRITDAVHGEEGLIFSQLWHTGRISHPDTLGGELPVGPSAVKPEGKIATPNGEQNIILPRPLETDEVMEIVRQFQKAAENAKNSGFDGIELHAANGYLIDQFLQDVTNKRRDKYGGNIENRSRFLFEIIEAVTQVWDSRKVGIRLSPSSTFNGMGDSDPIKIFGYVIERLNNYDLAYLHLVGPTPDVDEHPQFVKNVQDFYGGIYKGTRIANGNYDRKKANEAIASGKAELVSFARLFLANPDLPRRFALKADLNDPDPDTFYGGQEEGYIDYPFLGQVEK